jgi:hypothetical protein
MPVAVMIVAAIAGASKHTARAGEDRAAHAADNTACGTSDQTTGQCPARGASV